MKGKEERKIGGLRERNKERGGKCIAHRIKSLIRRFLQLSHNGDLLDWLTDWLIDCLTS